MAVGFSVIVRGRLPDGAIDESGKGRRQLFEEGSTDGRCLIGQTSIGGRARASCGGSRER
jgi:hypothetical protein